MKTILRFCFGALAALALFTALGWVLTPIFAADTPEMKFRTAIYNDPEIIRAKEGANGRSGLATLSGGSATVATTALTSNSRIFYSRQGGGSRKFGELTIEARAPGVGFTIGSAASQDDSTVAWFIVEALP